MENKVLLSILIPTYNGASSFLEKSLACLLPAVEPFGGEVEVIVSDNCSTDSTSDLLKSFCNYSCLRVYRNNENLGFNTNMKLLIDKYSTGQYSWMIGDDDIIFPNALSFIYQQLKKGMYDYISVKHKDITEDEAKYLTVPVNVHYSVHESNFGYAIDINSQMGNTLGSFMSSNICRTEMCRKVPKERIVNAFDNFVTIFPNAYITVTAFSKAKCCYIPETSLYAVNNFKAWQTEENAYLIMSNALVDLYSYYIEMGVSAKSLQRNYKRILFLNLYTGCARLIKRKRVAPFFFKAILASYKYPSIFFKVLKALVFRFHGHSVSYND